MTLPGGSLKDLSSIAFDLDFVEKACVRLLALNPQDDADGVERLALWSSAVIFYARCFGSGTRTSMPQSVRDKMTKEERDTHKRIWRERDKYVAHVEFTREEITAVERLQTSGTGVTLAHGVHMVRFTHDPDEVTRLKGLAAGLRAVLGVLIDAEIRATYR